MRKMVCVLLVLLCLPNLAGAAERAVFSGVVEARYDMLAGEDFSYKEILLTGKEARGKGAIMFKGVRMESGKLTAVLGVRSFLDGHFTAYLQQGDIFVVGNRFFKILRLGRKKDGPFAGSHALTVGVFKIAQ